MKYAVYDPNSPIDNISDNIEKFGGRVFLKLKVSLLSISSNDSSICEPSVKAYKKKCTKYKNISSTISIARSYEPYLALEYPDSTSNFGKEFIKIPVSSIDYLIDELRPWLKNIRKVKNLRMISTLPKLELYPSPTDVLELYPDVYMENNKPAGIGIRMVFNNKYTYICQFEKWSQFLYILMTADLYGMACTAVSMVTPYILGSMEPVDMSNKSPIHFVEDDKETEETTKFSKNSKPITENEKKKSFFDD